MAAVTACPRECSAEDPMTQPLAAPSRARLPTRRTSRPLGDGHAWAKSLLHRFAFGEATAGDLPTLRRPNAVKKSLIQSRYPPRARAAGDTRMNERRNATRQKSFL